MIKQQHLKKIIDQQFKIAKVDLKFEDVCENKMPNWYKKYTCTEEENKKWVAWMKKYIKDNLKMTNDRALIQAAWINLNYGLKIKKQK